MAGDPFKVGDLIESSNPEFRRCRYRVTTLQDGYATLQVFQSSIKYISAGHEYRNVPINNSRFQLATDDPDGW